MHACMRRVCGPNAINPGDKVIQTLLINMRANIEENNTCTEAITVLRRRLQAQMQPQATLLCKFTHTVLYIHVIVYYTHARMHCARTHCARTYTDMQ